MDGLDKRMLGRNIRQARSRLGLTQAQMAERIDMTPEVYGRMERGHIAPRLERFVMICRVLGESPDQLMSRAIAVGQAEKPLDSRAAAQKALEVLRKDLAANVRAARKRLRWTRARMADRLRMTADAYAAMERGELLPSLESFVAICRLLGEMVGPEFEKAPLPPRPKRARHR